MYGFTRRILALSVFALTSTVIFPLFVPAQSDPVAVQQRFQEVDRRLDRLDKIPEQLAGIQVEVSALKESINRIWNVCQIVGLSLLGAVGIKFLEVFGVRIARKEKT